MVQLNQNFIDSISADIPSHLSVEDLIDYCGRPLRRAIRVNQLTIDCEDFITHMQAKGWQFEPIPWCDSGFWITGQDDDALGNSIEHQAGWFYIQEASSMLPPTALATSLPAGGHVLDMAAAPGSKTTQLAALMADQGVLVANEYSSSRVKVLAANIARMGISNTLLTHFDGRVFGEYLYEQFDAVLIDAPCGGEGTVRKDADALKHWDINDVMAIAKTQAELIESAFLALKPGAELVYSTCTLNRHENQDVCLQLQQKYPDAVEFVSLGELFDGAKQALTPEGFLHVWPQIYDSEGFFVAKIRKTQSVARLAPAPKPQKNFPFEPVKSKQYQAVKQYFNSLGIDLAASGRVWVRDDEYWLFPHDVMQFIGKMRYQRIGIKLADAIKSGFKPRYEAIMALSNDGRRIVALDETQAQQYLMGRDIHFEPSQAGPLQGEVIVCYQHRPLGMGKKIKDKLKNQLPRELVKDKVTIL
ncbi:16S rRNA (cytosine(1407)-C(5))-methyltransferase RsmF [Shewanella sp. NIFS-20-20]|uniref:16S rRNA (cytosine(1407)-C(5))-methyltransferase RsmF n=1 Tax=Shewanella sp. NIFS-20-20 TaxID=2853806 RepID=UPI001C46152C|nr:16S rRNA (cytosine(1407)-C(5))-methyltransferase RsmF [Shewanella sp. NIFS-20-20]MBV7314601.1 16S rRNA (cytosine(1407)-C(5))-methyltransferase RsmF [Shewanella sp. NIFS-20-20]